MPYGEVITPPTGRESVPPLSPPAPLPPDFRSFLAKAASRAFRLARSRSSCLSRFSSSRLMAAAEFLALDRSPTRRSTSAA